MIERYFHGCNTGDLELLESCFAPDVSHYFLAPNTAPVHGARNLAAYWRGLREAVSARWAVDRVIESGDEAAIEWSMFFSSPLDGRPLTIRGSEWYVFQRGLIKELRAYDSQDLERDTDLQGSPYGERGSSAS